ncbi:MAG: asparaginase [Desulfitobacteriaceae bacterium]|nr:asparaginase [Desulfitobacteriaceae bacterium]MDI6877787.1 asparaginase [Desulfitobacteriaceae bacterium]MDI6912874.1 asparaginase [Desulfitobacteriaceae bacterium]
MVKYALITTGGTIAMKKNAAGKAVPALEGTELLGVLPPSHQGEWEVIHFSNQASSNMTPDRMLQLSQILKEVLGQGQFEGVVVTHGTDTLEETAFFLSLTVPTAIPVVLTAAQRDASETDSDGPRNLHNAMRIVKSPGVRGRGVLVSLHSQIHAAREVRKLHTSQPDAFSSGAAGIVGYVDGDEVFWLRRSLPAIRIPLPERLANVPIVKAYTGMNPAFVEYLLGQGAEALVIEAFGRGNLPPDLVSTIAKAVSVQGIPIVITSRCPFGRTAPLYGYPGGGADLERAGAWFSGDLSSEKTRLFLALTLGLDTPKPTLKAWLEHGGLEA